MVVVRMDGRWIRGKSGVDRGRIWSLLEGESLSGEG